ncbi:hypothetical protein P280DRAFT_469340 [Massarina eburnea CBS 473.64]|uniref:t-SNARE coiled-coil homology domain-containing protein n=1 Tax=Massarina eburnea CBS 473.64 TaxID=1395130 RepID=A0A6A6S2J1_9PLEO|nr:hypothetical protein P280DRAFT_469340 [Massarina eburnea CBS 473.64]
MYVFIPPLVCLWFLVKRAGNGLDCVTLHCIALHWNPGADQFQLTVAIGDEIRDSSSLADKMNDQFETSRLKIKGTMTRMLRMAEKTGVGWKVWVAFFAAVSVLFWYVWLF